MYSLLLKTNFSIFFLVIAIPDIEDGVNDICFDIQTKISYLLLEIILINLIIFVNQW